MKDIIQIKRFTNPSGENVWRLEWRERNPDSSMRRQRRNYRTKEEAVAERQKQEIISIA